MKKSERMVVKMKDAELKEKFIEMRVAGDSYDKIAKELNKSKTTLIKWDRELSKEISNLEFFDYKALLEKHKLTQKAKIEFFVEEIEKIKKALQNKDYNNIAIGELTKLLEKYENDLNKEIKGIHYCTGEFRSFNFNEPIVLQGETEIIESLY